MKAEELAAAVVVASHHQLHDAITADIQQSYRDRIDDEARWMVVTANLTNAPTLREAFRDAQVRSVYSAESEYIDRLSDVYDIVFVMPASRYPYIPRVRPRLAEALGE